VEKVKGLRGFLTLIAPTGRDRYKTLLLHSSGNFVMTAKLADRVALSRIAPDLADIVALSLTALKHRWRNPLNRMKSGAVGLYPLPVELWHEIFTIAANPHERMQEVLHSVLTPLFFSKEEDIFRKPFTPQHRLSLRTRHSIILVCKSWYFMGIPILWYHLHFNEEDPRKIGTMIYSAIRRNPTLASHVVRLTIRSVLFRRENLVLPETIHTVEKFVPLLTNLEAISCSLPYATHIYPVTRPRLVILINCGQIKSPHSSIRNRLIGSVTPLLWISFWIHCNTLSLSLFRPVVFEEEYNGHQLRFENLTSLRLEVFNEAVIRWIERCWQFPVLKDLSLIYTASIGFIAFLGRVQTTLERLEMSDLHDSPHRDYDHTHEVELPKLREISLVDVFRWSERRRQGWFTAIKAPDLRKVVISLRPDQIGSLSPSSVTDYHRNILECFPSVRKVIMIAPPEGERELELLYPS
jgi:hypothetical protein